MVIAAPEPKVDLQPIGEQRVVLRGLSWEAYLQILNALPQARGSRLTYDAGKEWLCMFLAQAKEDEIEATRSLRAWWQQENR